MNDVTLIGNLADEPKTSAMATGATKCTFRLATQRKYANQQTGQRETDFHIRQQESGQPCQQGTHTSQSGFAQLDNDELPY